MGIFKSKKFMVAVGAVIVAVVAHYVPALEGSVEQIVQLAMAFIVGQGLADLGKEAKK